MFKTRPSQVAIKQSKGFPRVAYMAKSEDTHDTYSLDSDSFAIGINTHVSFSMYNNRHHFIRPIKPSKSSMVIGVNGSLPILGSWTVKWDVTDDDGRQHVFKISNTLYVPCMKSSTLSPQH